MTDINKSDFAIDANLVGSDSLACWQKPYDRFNIYFFTAIHSSEQELLDSYAKIRDYIAVYFQGSYLSLDVERWNIYQFHLLGCKIDPNKKQVIEQDKFATRKIVLDGLTGTFDDQRIKSLIEREVFFFSVQRRDVQHQPVLEFIGQRDQQLATYLTQQAPEREALIKSLIDTFGNG
ncbi:ABC-three component system middle component 1 [Pedobacter sp. KBW06]|uniref:ABC-three component system middle component 1 n=1 Tax=Pedobacter sp. KBW06 TaxID=2153359 RepID=UPI0013156C1E|nr:ABC-three component system middle component 1 [Pedobacter sp. KBW06]